MTTTYDLLVSWLLSLQAIDQAGITEVNEYEDPESYLCGAAYQYLVAWEREVLYLVYMFGPIPGFKQDYPLIKKGFLLLKDGFVFPTASTCSFMELMV